MDRSDVILTVLLIGWIVMAANKETLVKWANFLGLGTTGKTL